MGYETERFESEISDELICPICSGVLEDPITTHCDHLFCRECIGDWLKTSQSCPIDRCILRACMLRQAPRVIRNLINRLSMSCAFREHGCSEVLPIESCAQHQQECRHNPSRLVTCNLYCRRTMPAHEMRHHNCVDKLLVQLHNSSNRVVLLERRIIQLYIALVILLLLYFILPAKDLLAIFQWYLAAILHIWS